jgi:hypothetical protein
MASQSPSGSLRACLAGSASFSVEDFGTRNGSKPVSITVEYIIGNPVSSATNVMTVLAFHAIILLPMVYLYLNGFSESIGKLSASFSVEDFGTRNGSKPVSITVEYIIGNPVRMQCRKTWLHL